MSIFISAILILMLIVAAGLSLTTIVITQQQTATIIETFGKFAGVRRPGLTFKAPWPIQSASAPISLQIREISVRVGVKASDNVFLDIPIRAQFCVDDTKVADAYYKLENPEKQIESYLVNQVRSSASSKSFDELYASKDVIEIEAKEALSTRMAEFGYIIENVLVDDPQPSQDVRDAFDKVLASKRLLEAAENEGKALKVKAVAHAEAEAEALKLRGTALVDFRKTITGGNAEAVKEFTQDTGLSAKDAMAFITNINEMEALTRVGEAGGRVVYIGAAARDAGVDMNSAMLNGQPSPNEPSKIARGKVKGPETPAPAPQQA